MYLLRFASKFIILNFLANENVCIKLHYFRQKIVIPLYWCCDVIRNAYSVVCSVVHFHILSQSAKCLFQPTKFRSHLRQKCFLLFIYGFRVFVKIIIYFTTEQPDTNRNIIISHSFCFIYCNVAITHIIIYVALDLHNYSCHVSFMLSKRITVNHRYIDCCYKIDQFFRF